MDHVVYETRQLFVSFECTSNKVKCTIYRKGTERTENFKVLQTFTMPRPGFKRLDGRTQRSVLRQVLKAMRNRQTMALNVVLNNRR